MGTDIVAASVVSIYCFIIIMDIYSFQIQNIFSNPNSELDYEWRQWILVMFKIKNL